MSSEHTSTTLPSRAPLAGSRDGIFPLAYEELKRLARRQLRVHEDRATLCTTELVHEAFLRLRGVAPDHWQDRAHLVGYAAKAMRHVLVDFARRRCRTKRGGDWVRVSNGDTVAPLDVEMDQMLALDAALVRLDEINPRLRRVVELRFFAGLSEEAIASMLDVSTRTVERDWFKARVFLLSELQSS